jgi:flagellar motor component MotA
MNTNAIIGLVVAVSLVLVGINMGSPLIIFFDLTSVLLVVVASAALLLATHGRDAGLILTGLGRWLMPGSIDPWSPAVCRKAAHVANSGGSLAIMAGALGSLIGLIQMLQNMDDPSSIGPAMAVALLTVFYALGLNLLLFVPLARFFTEAAIEERAEV